jgi:hypothetical protein
MIPGEVGLGEFHCLVPWTQQQFENYLRIVAPPPPPMILLYLFPQGWWLTGIDSPLWDPETSKIGPGFKPSVVQVKLLSALSATELHLGAAVQQPVRSGQVRSGKKKGCSQL